MKKIFLANLAVIIMLSFTMAALAQEELKVKGTVTKIDTSAKSVTIKTKDGAEVTVVMDNPDMLSRVKVNDKGEARYVVKNGVNAGVRLRKLVEGCE